MSFKFNREDISKNRNSGITLIALVVTIVVLIILAVVTINITLSNDGIFKLATYTKERTEIAEAKEQAQLDILAWKSMKMAKGENSDLDDLTIQGILTGKSYVETADTSSFTTANGGYIIRYSELYAGGIDWELAKAEATKHPNQSSTNGDIGIGTDGNPVNLDLWTYTVINGNEISLNDDYGCGCFPGYSNTKIVNGEIQGKVPQYIKIAGQTDFYPVTSMEYTFENCSDLVIAPKIPSTVRNMASAFKSCTGLTTAPIISNNVTNLRATFYGCSGLTGDLIINANASNLTDYQLCLSGAATNEGTDLKLSGSCEALSNILSTKSGSSNISLK